MELDEESKQFLHTQLDPNIVYDVNSDVFEIPEGAYTIEKVEGEFYEFTEKEQKKVVYVNKTEPVVSDLRTLSGMKKIGTHEDDFRNYYHLYRLKDGSYVFNTVKGTFYKFSKSITGKTNLMKERNKARRMEYPDIIYVPENQMRGIDLNYRMGSDFMITHLGGRRNRRRTKRARKHRRYSRRR